MKICKKLKQCQLSLWLFLILQLTKCKFLPKVPTATSQHMDDLFDILIESGGKNSQLITVLRLERMDPDMYLHNVAHFLAQKYPL